MTDSSGNLTLSSFSCIAELDISFLCVLDGCEDRIPLPAAPVAANQAFGLNLNEANHSCVEE